MMGMPDSKAGWESYGWGVVSVGVEGTSSVGRSELAHRLAAVLEDPDWSPPVLPEVATQLVELTRKPNTSVADVARVLTQDPALAAQLIRRANSAAYATTARVNTVRDAAVRVGLLGVRNLAIEIALSMRVFRAAGYQATADALRRRSVAVAALAAVVCRSAGLPTAEAFLCGLLSDVGLAVGLMVLGERTRGPTRPDLSLVWPSLIEIHEQLSARMAARWNLAPETAFVLANHHDLRVDGEAHPMIAALIVAEGLAERLGARFPNPPEATSVPRISYEDEAREALGLNEARVDALMREGSKVLREFAG